MGNCFSSEKGASSAAQTAPTRREKPGSLPHIEATGGKLSTSADFASEKPKETTATPEVPKTTTTSQENADDAGKRESGSATVDSGKGMSGNESLKESTAETLEEQPEPRHESTLNAHTATTIAEPEQSQIPAIPEQVAETSVLKNEETPAKVEKEAVPTAEKELAPVAAKEEAHVPVESAEISAASTKEETTAPAPFTKEAEPSTVTAPATEPAVVEPTATPTAQADSSNQAEPATSAAAAVEPVVAEPVAAEQAAVQPTVASAAPETPTTADPKSPQSLPPLNTTLPPSSSGAKDVPTETATTISPSSLKSPQTALTHQESALTTPPTSAHGPRPTTSSSTKGNLSLFPAAHEPPASPAVSIPVPITPQNTTVDTVPVATTGVSSQATIPARTQSTTEKVKRQSRMSRMFSIGSKKDKTDGAPVRTSSLLSGKKSPSPIATPSTPPTIAEEPTAKTTGPSPPPAINTYFPPQKTTSQTAADDVARPGSKMSTSKHSATNSGSGTGTAADVFGPASAGARSDGVISPSVEGRKWNQEGDNESLYCY